MRLDPTDISGGIFKDYSHSDTCLLGKGWRTLTVKRINKRCLYRTNKTIKNHMEICYHAFREASAAGIWKVRFMKIKQNIATFLLIISQVHPRRRSLRSGCVGNKCSACWCILLIGVMCNIFIFFTN